MYIKDIFKAFLCTQHYVERRLWREEPSHQVLQVWPTSACRTISSFPKGKVSVRLKRATGITRETQRSLSVLCLSASTIVKEQNGILPGLQSQCWRHNLCSYPASEGREHGLPAQDDVLKIQVTLCLLQHFLLQPVEIWGYGCGHSEESPFLIKLIQKS